MSVYSFALLCKTITVFTTNEDKCIVFLISSFRRVLYVVCFILGNYTASDNYPKESIQMYCSMNSEDNCILIGKTWRDEGEG
jgi:hypothetical protein